MIPLTDDEIKSYEKQKACHICKEGFCYDKNKKSEYALNHKVRDHCHYTGKSRGAAHNICNLRYKVSKKISVVFQNGSTYDYHFIIKKLAEVFKGQFECLGENTEKCITFSVLIKKEVTNGKEITYKFMQSRLSSLADNLSEINKRECLKSLETKIKSECGFIGLKNDRLHYKCKKCGKRCTKSINGLVKKFPSICQFCNDDLNKFVLLLRKGVYPYEYMDSWERFNETSLPNKKAFYSKLNLEDITDKDYEHAQKV